MPTYDYQCQSCAQDFSVVHSFKTRQESCIHCASSSIVKVVAPFAAKTETSAAAQNRRIIEQCKQDSTRLDKDEKFLANILGVGDTKSEERKLKVAADNAAYIKSKQELIAKESKSHPQQIRKKTK